MPALDANVSAMLHMDGADASTTFTDETGKTWTANGNAQIDTAQQKFGTASGLFDGTGDYIDTPDHADFDIGSGDFTIDFWVRRNAVGLHRICGQGDNLATATTISWAMYFNAGTNTLTGGFNVVAVTKAATSTGTVTADGIWHHIAMVRYGNTMTLYIDGTADGTVDVTGATANNSAYKPTIGRLGELAGQNYNGWIDEFRFSKGIARWTANFTPPTKAYYSFLPHVSGII